MFILQIAFILIASKLAGNFAVKLGQPSVLGKLLVGILLGPSVLGLIQETEMLHEFSEIGVILLMFIAGLETDIKELKQNGKASTFVGLGGSIVPLALGYVAGMMLNLSTLESWFLGLLLSATSVSISVQALKDMHQLKTPEGTTVLGAAVIDDVVVIVALAFLMSFVGQDIHLTTIIVQKIIFFAGAIFVGWKVVPWFLRAFSILKVNEALISGGLIVCFVFAYLAEYTGVAGIIGAYIAGVSISTTNFKHEIFKKTEVIGYSIFVPIFFASIGVTAHFSDITENIWLIVGLSVLAIATKFVGASIGAKMSGFQWNSSWSIGSAMISRGEVALIIASLGLESGLLSENMFAALVVVVLVTTIVTPPLMKIFFLSKQENQAPIGLEQ